MGPSRELLNQRRGGEARHRCCGCILACIVLTALPFLVSPALANPALEFREGREAFQNQEFRRAERHFRALTRSIPDHVIGCLYLGHSLFYQKKYKQAVKAYETAISVDDKTSQLEHKERRVLTDQLGMAYGLDGRLARAKEIFEATISRDPEYSMFYYNLACVFAELGDLDAALLNLRRGLERHRASETDHYPNPRDDDSFKRFLGNERFEAAIKEMGFCH